MSKPVTNISVTDGIASFDFMKSEPTAIHSLPADNTPAGDTHPADNTHPAGDTPASSSTFSTAQLLYEFGSLQIYRLPDGSIRKVLKPRFQHNRQ